MSCLVAVPSTALRYFFYLDIVNPFEITALRRSVKTYFTEGYLSPAKVMQFRKFKVKTFVTFMA